ncbi:hypothetical protein CHU98_g9796 [Xylaria longipes]|nr:hypothetical protein CHU98_g9796 [Xylaria longipes]
MSCACLGYEQRLLKIEWLGRDITVCLEHIQVDIRQFGRDKLVTLTNPPTESDACIRDIDPSRLLASVAWAVHVTVSNPPILAPGLSAPSTAPPRD